MGNGNAHPKCGSDGVEIGKSVEDLGVLRKEMAKVLHSLHWGIYLLVGVDKKYTDAPEQ